MYADDLPVFEWFRGRARPPARRCLEAQVMDWSDDVAYSRARRRGRVASGRIDLRPSGRRTEVDAWSPSPPTSTPPT